MGTQLQRAWAYIDSTLGNAVLFCPTSCAILAWLAAVTYKLAPTQLVAMSHFKAVREARRAPRRKLASNQSPR